MSDLLTAARALLEARENQMVTRLEWEALASAVAEATPPLDEARVYEGFLEVWSDACLAAGKSALRAEGVAYTEHIGGWRFDLPAVTAGQYGRVVEALIDAGEAGVEWRFAVE